MSAPQPWWKTDKYEIEAPVPDGFHALSGPVGTALVRVWESGKTDPGWGLNGRKGQAGFMMMYRRKRFDLSAIREGYEKKFWDFAFVMRSLKMVCIDIDGKNGGLENAGRLGMLPWTLAETSRSGNGFHLFYVTEEDEWDDDEGFALYQDRIGLVQGVDIRAVGCVYHYRSQRWNGRPLALLPAHIGTMLRKKAQLVSAQVDAIIKILDNGDQTEVAIMQDALMTDLAKPIPAGRRNNTLFAIGNQLKQAGVPSWENHLYDRAIQVGLDKDEATKLVGNVTKYGDRP